MEKFRTILQATIEIIPLFVFLLTAGWTSFFIATIYRGGNVFGLVGILGAVAMGAGTGYFLVLLNTQTQVSEEDNMAAAEDCSDESHQAEDESIVTATYQQPTPAMYNNPAYAGRQTAVEYTVPHLIYPAAPGGTNMNTAMHAGANPSTLHHVPQAIGGGIDPPDSSMRTTGARKANTARARGLAQARSSPNEAEPRVQHLMSGAVTARSPKQGTSRQVQASTTMHTVAPRELAKNRTSTRPEVTKLRTRRQGAGLQASTSSPPGGGLARSAAKISAAGGRRGESIET
ncbi:MAG: hypothetical protein SVY53_15670 [Chloroflexota bacterium]|nr:hypothetical protein [Chloroflexota bacterium]